MCCLMAIVIIGTQVPLAFQSTVSNNESVLNESTKRKLHSERSTSCITMTAATTIQMTVTALLSYPLSAIPVFKLFCYLQS